MGCAAAGINLGVRDHLAKIRSFIDLPKLMFDVCSKLCLKCFEPTELDLSVLSAALFEFVSRLDLTAFLDASFYIAFGLLLMVIF